MGVPVVSCCFIRSSWKTPERIFTASGSRRWVTNLLCPGRRRSRSFWISASVRAMPGGQPSITQPSAGPWLSPKVVTRNIWPKVLNDISLELQRFGLRVQPSDLAIAYGETHALGLVQAVHAPPVHAA